MGLHNSVKCVKNWQLIITLAKVVNTRNFLSIAKMMNKLKIFFSKNLKKYL